jgi:hypothetical protein
MHTKASGIEPQQAMQEGNGVQFPQLAVVHGHNPQNPGFLKHFYLQGRTFGL